MCLSWSRQVSHAETWKGKTNWPQHIVTYNKPQASLSDCLCLWPANSLQRVPLSSSAPGSRDRAVQKWHCLGCYLFFVSGGLSEELWKKTPAACTAAITQAWGHNPTMKWREKKVVEKVITPGQRAFPKHHHWVQARFWDCTLTLVIP